MFLIVTANRPRQGLSKPRVETKVKDFHIPHRGLAPVESTRGPRVQSDTDTQGVNVSDHHGKVPVKRLFVL